MSDDAGERIRRFLVEFRMLVTAVGVLVGFQLQAAFSASFMDLPGWARGIHTAGLLFGIASFTALLVPASVHRVVSEVRHVESFLRLARRSFTVALLCLAFSLAASMAVHGARMTRPFLGVAMGLAVMAFTLAAWFGLPFLLREHLGRNPR